MAPPRERQGRPYLRPAAGLHSLSLLDDLTAEAIERMKEEGFEAATVVETSPNNFQVWMNHGQILDAARGTDAAKQLAGRFGGDPSSADWRHFGRLAGAGWNGVGATTYLGKAGQGVTGLLYGDPTRVRADSIPVNRLPRGVNLRSSLVEDRSGSRRQASALGDNPPLHRLSRYRMRQWLSG